MEEHQEPVTIGYFLQEGQEGRLQDLINTIVKRSNAMIPVVGTHSTGTNLPPSLYLFLDKDGKPAIEIVDVTRYMRDSHTKDMLTIEAQKLIRKHGAGMTVLAAESWALDPDAPKEEQDKVLSGQMRVSESKHKTTILSLNVQAPGHRHEMSVYRYDPKSKRFETEPAFSSIHEEKGEVQTRWDFFAPTIEEMMEDCDTEGPIDGNLRGL